MELNRATPRSPQESNHEGDSSCVMLPHLVIQATSKQEDFSSVTSLPLAFQATSKQEESNSVMSLPLEILHRLLSHCSIPDVLSFAQALGRPELIGVQRIVWILLWRRHHDLVFFQVLKRPGLWSRATLGPRLHRESLPFIGDHTIHLTVLGSVKLDKKQRPRKERFFKSTEFVPTFLLTGLTQQCARLRKLTFDLCVFGPQTKSSLFPPTLEQLTFRSCIFVRKSSFFDSIWSNIPSLKELRIENILSFSKRDCYAVLTSLSIDFDIQFSNDAASPTFIFYRS